MPTKSIPDGWQPVSAVGKLITGTRFLPFKVPLKDTVCKNLKPWQRFSPTILMEAEPKLQLIIDLTNTKRYYDTNDFTNNGLQHYKISCPGQIIPPLPMVQQFFNVVDKFMQSANDEEKYIGVHCTHGINRTGYFICKYMIEKLGYTVKNAIFAFQEARGHAIYRQYFIDELYNSTASIPSAGLYPPGVLPPLDLYPPNIVPSINYRPINISSGRHIPRGGSSRHPSNQRKFPPMNSDNLKCRLDHDSRQSQLNYYDGEQSSSNRYQISHQNNKYRKTNHPARGNQSIGFYNETGSHRNRIAHRGGNSSRGRMVPKEKDCHKKQQAPNKRSPHTNRDTNTKKLRKEKNTHELQAKHTQNVTNKQK